MKRSATIPRPIEQKTEHIKALIFAALQSFITSGVASAISSARAAGPGEFALLWLTSWLYAWAIMLPIVLTLAPGLRRLIDGMISVAATLSMKVEERRDAAD